MKTTRFEHRHANNGEVRLTSREAEILCVIAQGHSSQETADFLCVSKRTVDFHLANAYIKLNVSNRIQAIQVAGRLGILRGEDEFEVFRNFRDAIARARLTAGRPKLALASD